MTLQDKVNEVAREDLSPYCLNQCSTTCCDLSHIILITSKISLHLILGENADLSKYKIENGMYCYQEGICPQYDEKFHKCKIYLHPDRPKACEIFPFLISNKGGDDDWVAVNHKCEYMLQPQRILSLSDKLDVDVWLLE